MWRPMANLMLLSLASPLMAASVALESPDQKIRFQLTDDAGKPRYSLQYQTHTVLAESDLGLVFRQQGDFSAGFRIAGQQQASKDETWTQPWGERAQVRDQHNELLVRLQHPKRGYFDLRVRAFNDGIGFRYEFPNQKGLSNPDISDELTEFRFPEPQATEALWIPARAWNRYEFLYTRSPLTQMPSAHTPATFVNPAGIHLSIHEAALTDYAAMTLNQRRDGVLKADLTPWSDGIKVKIRTPAQGCTHAASPGCKNAAFVTPWRTVQISPDAKGLLNSNLILNLNEPNALGDVSWVKPGKYLGIWWGMHLGTQTWGSGTKHGATTDNTKRMMDFAAEHGFDGVLVEGWNTGWDGEWFNNGALFSFTQSYPDFDMAAIGRYGKEKGVKLIGHHETSGHVSHYRKQMGDAFDLYAKHGVSQVKTGYVADGGNITRIDEKGLVRKEWHDGQFMVNEYLHNVREAARRKISINTHEPIKDTGLRRTYPNWLSREGARGQEFNAWGSPPNPPEHTVNLVYTRMLSGPMDFTPGIFNLGWNGLDSENRVQTTLAKQLALYVVLYSPVQMAADLPENYQANLPAFQFIKDVVTDWRESIALQGELGDYVVFTRQARANNDWFLGAITDEQARQLTVPLGFLGEGKKYRAEIYRDGDNAHWKTSPYDMVIEKRTVEHTDSLTLKLAAGGGTAIRFVELAQ